MGAVGWVEAVADSATLVVQRAGVAMAAAKVAGERVEAKVVAVVTVEDTLHSHGTCSARS